jgi:flagellar export protein FliJ
MRFHFRLARVLKIKGIWEDQAKLKLATAVASQEQEQRLMDQKKAYWHQALTHLGRPGLRQADELAHHYLLARLAQDACERQRLRVKEATLNLATAQKEFLRCRSDRQVLSRLEGRKQAQFNQEIQRMDRIKLDEIASISHLKRQRGL